MSTVSGVGSSASSAWWQVGSGRASDRKERLFAKADGNGDGSVDATELQSLLDRGAERSGSTAPNAADLMKTMDADGSGGLDADELDAGMKSLMPPPSSTVDFAQRRGEAPPPPPTDDSVAATDDTDASSSLLKSLEDLFKAVDSNADGTLESGEVDTLKSKLDTALQSLEGGSTSSTDDATATASTGVSAATGSSDAAWLALTQLVLKEYGSASTASSTSQGQTAAIDTTA